MAYTRLELARVSAILPCLVVLPAAAAVRAAVVLKSSRTFTGLNECPKRRASQPTVIATF
jgi:hypothetical protein